VFVHYLDECLFDMVLNCDKTVNLYWVLWGLDYYGPDDFFMDMLFEPKTKTYITHGTGKYYRIPFPKNPFNIPKYLRASKELKNNRELFMRTYMPQKLKVVQRFNFICSYCEPDFEFVKRQYQASGEFKHLYYTMFDEKDVLVDESKTSAIISRFNLANKKIILAGHSGSLYLNQLDILEPLNELTKGRENLAIVYGLSYGAKEYSEYIYKKAKKILKERFYGLKEYMTKSDYYSFLNGVDVAIMNQKVNVAGTNIFVLLFLGKKVYLRPEMVHYKYLSSQGVKIFDLKDIYTKSYEEIIKPLNDNDRKKNRERMIQIFSKEKAKANYKAILN
jgi:hypothetical protein